ncbi:CyP450 monooxygenase [Trametes meyenii]|nr:CyP450 monooxygenase [Trametes meyenii]
MLEVLVYVECHSNYSSTTHAHAMNPCGLSFVNTAYLSVAIASLFYIRALLRCKARKRGLSLPPGPPRLPIVGNLLNMPKIKPWEGYRSIRKIYGDITYLQVFAQPIVIIGKVALATEYLEKHSANTSDRPSNPVFELSGQDFNFAFMPYGEWWRRHRRTLWQHFHRRAATKYQPTQKNKTLEFLYKLLKTPSRLDTHLKTLFTSTLLKIVYDVDAVDEDDEHARLADEAIEGIRLSTPGGFAVEVLPFLRHVPAWVPGAGFQSLLAQCKASNERLIHVLFDGAKESMRCGGLGPCLAGDMLFQGPIDSPSDPTLDQVFKNVCAVTFEAGADTTFIALQAVFVALALHPSVQKKAQDELDALVGPSRLPDFSDGDALVYTNALIKEVLRWHTITPLGMPHRVINDDEFCGHFIPAGTMVFANIWDMMHDPDVYEHPDEFRPERFIRGDKLDATAQDPFSIVFGFGRRICPGRHYAYNSLFIAVACVLHVFDIRLPLDRDGCPIQIKHEQNHGLLSRPADTRCTITPRSAEAASLILESPSIREVLTQHGV